MVQRHPSEAINNPKILGDIFAEMQRAYIKNKQPLTPNQSGQLISIMIADEATIDKMYESLNSNFPFNGFFSRCSIFPIKYEKRLLIFLGLLTYEFGIGGMILVGYWLQWWVKQRENEANADILKLDIVIESVFPFGFFSKETIHEFWEKQKVDSRPDNLVDHPTAAASFMMIEPANLENG